MIEFSIESAGYGGPPVLKEVKGELHSGEFTAILAMNGGGKSTLLRCLAGLHRSMQGEIRVEGQTIRSLSPQERADSMAFLPQSTQPAFAYQGREVIALGRYATGHGTRHHADDLSCVARRFEVEAFLDRRVDSLSGGEWQRIALARTFYQDARMLLLDEPTAHLDLSHRLATFEFCRQSAMEGKTVLAATHDLELAFEFADRLLFLKEGTTALDGAPEDVVTEKNIQDVFGKAGIQVGKNPFSQRPQLIVRQNTGGKS